MCDRCIQPIKSACIQKDIETSREDLEKKIERLERSLKIVTKTKSAAKEKQQDPAWLTIERYNNGDLTYEEITNQNYKSASVESNEPSWVILRRSTFGDV
ncbi:MAG: hypothetical protein ABR515_04085 [Nitrososphaeraceae archaeon]